jgi:hypothetical protein
VKTHERRRTLVVLLLGLALGVVGGWLVRGWAAPPGDAARPASPERGGRAPAALLPRRSLAVRNTILVGADPDEGGLEEADGKLVLRPSDLPRVLAFQAADADAAAEAIGRFVAALPPERVATRTPGEVVLDGIRVLWRFEGEGAERRFRVVALPADAYGSEAAASRTAEAIAAWTIVHGVHPTTATSFEEQAAVVTSVRAPGARAAVPPFDAAEQEFRARGMTLAEGDVVQSQVVDLVRDAEGRLLWSFFWSEDQAHGTFGVYHHADPFDTAGEQELLLAVLRRALGRDVKIRLDAIR